MNDTESIIAESIVEAMLAENDGLLGFKDIKDFILNIRGEVPPGEEFHLGFAIATSDERMIQDNAAEHGVQLDWDAVNEAVRVIENNAIRAMTDAGIQCRSEGHSGDNDLIGSAWVKTGTHGFNVITQFIEQGEPFRTSSGTIDGVAPGMAVALYQGVPEHIASLIDVDISFFDLGQVEQGIE